MIIDFHTHCFPDKLAERALAQLKKTSGDIESYSDGTVRGLIKSMDDNGVDISVVQNIATNAKQMKAVNDFAASINSDRIISFGSVFPGAENAFEELERIKELGLKGIKLHPEFQGFNVDDEKLKPLYKKISELGFILLFHSGADASYMPPYKSMPKSILKALSWLDCPVVAAHWGAFCYYEDVLKYLAGTEVYMDVSMGYGIIPKPVAEEIVRKHGADKLLYATDSPWQAPWMTKKVIECLDISDTEKEKIYYKNAVKLLNIKE